MGKIIENYSLQVELGRGAYSKVYKAINLKTKEEVAIKMVKADKFREFPKLQQGTINEINILTNLEACPHIVRYYDMLKTVNNFYFVYEYCNGGTLEQLLKKVGCLSEAQALLYFKQITDAFKILSRNNIMHRDLKPENILIHDGVLKIADFGFCKVLENPNQMAQTMLGSPIYMAPEILKGQPYTIKADVWSLGVILFRMMFGYYPFESVNIAKLIMLLQVQELVIPQQPKVSPIVVQLIRRMLTKDPQRRADWAEVFSYDISDKGIMRQSGFGKLSNDGLGKSSLTMASLSNQYQPTQQQSQSSVKVPNSSVKNFKVDFQMTDSKTSAFDKPQKTQDKNFLCRASYQRDRSKSPLRDKGSTKLDSYLKNHSKAMQILALALQSANYATLNAVALSYTLIKKVQAQLSNIVSSAQKQTTNDTNKSGQHLYQNVIKIVSQEIQTVRKSCNYYLSEIMSFKKIDLNEIQENKGFYFKQFIKGLQLEDKEELVMASRLIDYIEQSLLIRKETYQKLSKEQLQRQIKNNIKINQ